MSVSVHVLAKPPVPGWVNTRLEGALGRHGCARLARRQLDRTLAVAVTAGVGPVMLWMAGGAWHPGIRRVAVRHGVRLRAQRGEVLGERMAFVARRAFGADHMPILVGTDCTGLVGDDLVYAAELLTSGTDVVLGPARDGGYYLLGLRRPCAVLFSRMPWGSGNVLQETLRRLRQLDRCVGMLPVRADLDRPADLAGRSPFAVAAGA